VKKVHILLLLFFVMLVAFSGCRQEAQGNSNTPGSTGAGEVSMKTATIETGMGNIVIEFYPDDAPNTVNNFITLAKKGFYDGLTFHRIVPGFVIQGGDPKGDGSGGPGYTIAAEFNSRKHVEGTVAMARRGNDINSAGCQFYIALKRIPHLDKQYTVFGQVIEGMEVVHKIAAVPTGPGDRPIEPVVMKKVTVRE
jgi:peptidyl-prolyl cis-trans isomerase B (cyclophilin B)